MMIDMPFDLITPILFFVQDVDIRLTYANGGGRVDSERNSFRLRILPNDNPHGMVQFGLKSYQVEERVDSATQFIPITRV